MVTTGIYTRFSDIPIADYCQYMASWQWKMKREQKLQSCNYRCQFHDYGEDPCRIRFQSNMHVHHRSYANFGQEMLGDLQVLCPRHHGILTVRNHTLCHKCKETVSYFAALAYWDNAAAAFSLSRQPVDNTDWKALVVLALTGVSAACFNCGKPRKLKIPAYLKQSG